MFLYINWIYIQLAINQDRVIKQNFWGNYWIVGVFDKHVVSPGLKQSTRVLGVNSLARLLSECIVHPVNSHLSQLGVYLWLRKKLDKTKKYV